MELINRFESFCFSGIKFVKSHLLQCSTRLHSKEIFLFFVTLQNSQGLFNKFELRRPFWSWDLILTFFEITIFKSFGCIIWEKFLYNYRWIMEGLSCRMSLFFFPELIFLTHFRLQWPVFQIVHETIIKSSPLLLLGGSRFK